MIFQSYERLHPGHYIHPVSNIELVGDNLRLFVNFIVSVFLCIFIMRVFYNAGLPLQFYNAGLLLQFFILPVFYNAGFIMPVFYNAGFIMPVFYNAGLIMPVFLCSLL